MRARDLYSPYWRLVAPNSPAYLGSTVAEIQAAGFPVVPVARLQPGSTPWRRRTSRAAWKLPAKGLPR